MKSGLKLTKQLMWTKVNYNDYLFIYNFLLLIHGILSIPWVLKEQNSACFNMWVRQYFHHDEGKVKFVVAPHLSSFFVSHWSWNFTRITWKTATKSHTRWMNEGFWQAPPSCFTVSDKLDIKQPFEGLTFCRRSHMGRAARHSDGTWCGSSELPKWCRSCHRRDTSRDSLRTKEIR